MLERDLVNSGTNPAIVSCSGMRQKGNLVELVVNKGKQVRPQLKTVQAKKKDLVDSAKARRQEASSKVI